MTSLGSDSWGRKVARGNLGMQYILVIGTGPETEGAKSDSLNGSTCTPSCSQALGVDV